MTSSHTIWAILEVVLLMQLVFLQYKNLLDLLQIYICVIELELNHNIYSLAY